MKIHLNNGKTINIVGNKCNWGFWEDKIRFCSNQTGLDSQLNVNKNCNIIEIMVNHNNNYSFIIVDKKIIPTRSICYVEES